MIKAHEVDMMVTSIYLTSDEFDDEEQNMFYQTLQDAPKVEIEKLWYGVFIYIIHATFLCCAPTADIIERLRRSDKNKFDLLYRGEHWLKVIKLIGKIDSLEIIPDDEIKVTFLCKEENEK